METGSIAPLHDVVIIKRQEVEKVGSIYIPIESEEMREDIGIVMYVGPGATNDDGKILPMYVKAGDRVLFSTHGHQVTKIDGRELIVLRQNSIIAVWRDRPNEFALGRALDKDDAANPQHVYKYEGMGRGWETA